MKILFYIILYFVFSFSVFADTEIIKSSRYEYDIFDYLFWIFLILTIVSGVYFVKKIDK